MVEIRAGEGGKDSKNFVSELAEIYLRYARNKNLLTEILNSEDGSMSLQISGSSAWKAFELESGKHVIQRCPPTERGGRRHTSAISVAILPLREFGDYSLKEADLEIIFQKGKVRAGGQNANKVNSAVRMKHIPSGLSVFINGRDQGQNKSKAYEILAGRVYDHYYALENAEYSAKRKNILGDGGRGGAARTYNLYKSIIVDHRTGKQTNDVKSILKGELDLIL